jgi:hypothetical protein
MTTTLTAPTPATAVTPPAWATGPDSEGNFNGPSGEVARVAVSSSWSPTDGPVMWLDALLYQGDITPWQARRLAAVLVEVADAVESAQVASC